MSSSVNSGHSVQLTSPCAKTKGQLKLMALPTEGVWSELVVPGIGIVDARWLGVHIECSILEALVQVFVLRSLLGELFRLNSGVSGIGGIPFGSRCVRCHSRNLWVKRGHNLGGEFIGHWSRHWICRIQTQWEQ